MNAYVILTASCTVAGRFADIDVADRYGKGLDVDYYVVTDTDDMIKLMNKGEMVKAYNALTESALVKFPTKEVGAQRLWDALEAAELQTFLPAPAVKERRTRAYQPVGSGYRGHRIGSRKELAHKRFDELYKAGAGRLEILSAMIDAGVQENTAKNWYPGFKNILLKEAL